MEPKNLVSVTYGLYCNLVSNRIITLGSTYHSHIAPLINLYLKNLKLYKIKTEINNIPSLNITFIT